MFGSGGVGRESSRNRGSVGRVCVLVGWWGVGRGLDQCLED